MSGFEKCHEGCVHALTDSKKEEEHRSKMRIWVINRLISEMLSRSRSRKYVDSTAAS